VFADFDSPRLRFRTGDLFFYERYEAVVRVVIEMNGGMVLVFDESRERLIRADSQFLKGLLPASA
jgi:hypothetical protein